MRPFEVEFCNKIQNKLTLLNKLHSVSYYLERSHSFKITIEGTTGEGELANSDGITTLFREEFNLLDTNFRASIISLEQKLLEELK